jgi:hypothetical protein
VNKNIRRQTAQRKRRIARRLNRLRYPDDLSRPIMRETNIHYEMTERGSGTAYGGIGLIRQLVRELKLTEEIDSRLQLFKVHRPYHESDHVLNFAYHALCDGRCLEDLELRRQDEAYLNALGAERIPDPTTAADCCRRFERRHLDALQQAFDAARLRAWSKQPAEFFQQAIIEADGTMITTDAECKQGIDINYKGEWGYHPLVITLAGTGEVLRLINRSGNRPSHEGAAAKFDECVALCRAAGFQKMLLRGDTDFSQSRHLDRWHEAGDVTFVFGYDCTAILHVLADDLPGDAWTKLERKPKYTVKTRTRTKPERVKQRIIEQRGFKDLQLQEEWVAEFRYQPEACSRAYRMIVTRKDLRVNDPRQGRFFAYDYKYFFHITNDETSSSADVTFSANDRCHQENLLAQLQSCRALHAPVDTLLANEAYMLMTSSAWNLKAWLALMLPEESPHGVGRGATHAPREPHTSEKKKLLGLEFRTFVNYFLRLPTQVVRTGRKLVLRLLSWNEWQPVFFRLVEILTPPRQRPLRS